MAPTADDTTGQPSPAERYAAARRRAAEARTELGRFTATLGFPLDPFQLEACRELEAGNGVLVAAPTGAGKTVVGEFAIHLALAAGQKAFYTTPIKALSNQKYQDLVATYGAERVGLLTGDTAVNSHAEVVVMTTEVLRNMLYADSDTLANLGYVVMDEVHYLADRFRGAVWEEVIIHLPEHVQLVSLSATVSNAEEFGAWLDTVRGSTAVVVSEHRPVPLWQYVMAGTQLYDLFATEVAFDEIGPDTPVRDPGEPEGPDGGPAPGSGQLVLNPELARLAEDQRRREERSDWGRPGRGPARGGRGGGPRGRGRGGPRSGGRGGRGAGAPAAGRREEATTTRYGGGGSGGPGPAGGRHEAPGVGAGRDLRVSRPGMVRSLEREGLLPCITFVFSRAGCDGAVEQCLWAGLDLTTPGEKQRIQAVVDEAAQSLPPEDLDVLGFWGWRDGLSRGFAAHHAGMLPPFKEVVEQLFGAGLVKVVFATETLALGVNMPARTVVIEKLEKFNGEAHVNITAGEYTQLTGRAGRRGIDVEGHAVVLWRPGLDPAAVAGLASRRTYPLNSSFRPTYNMSVNLIAQFGLERSRSILESSFAQFQADRSVVGLAREVRSREESLAGYERSMTCHLGDFTEYARLRKELSEAEKDSSKGRHRARQRAVRESLAGLQPGDVIEVRGPRRLGTAVVVFPAGNPANPRVGVITEQAQLRRISAEDVDEPVDPVAGARLPQNIQVKTPTQRKDIAAAMRAAVREHRPAPGGRTPAGFRFRDEGSAERVEELRRQLERHPCHGCKDREEHARWAERWWRLRREVDQLSARIAGRTNTIARAFDRLVGLLATYGYVDAAAAEAGAVSGTDAAPGVTPAGQTLRRIYGERDLLTSLLLEDGLARDLDPEELAGLAALLVYQAKGDESVGVPQMPSARLQHVLEQAAGHWYELQLAERAAQLEPTPEPDPGLVWPIHRWARGRNLRDALKGTDLAPGDFVRWARQVIDLLDQLSKVPGHPGLPRQCQRAVDLVRRGVVAYSSVDTLDG
ncbi:DEAD/DEAH box helicase [Citricoccus sp. SGAir0253]|uniref:DEAD/DEAH box helicase n=1 Tax=Citricoccus sp. SGAir0253 TaxID=2567881 RepID=UPI0010CD3852|nr:DEAD/DEAH box helicase [Citricoccus sp. SGAir0253]QCU78055.1 DEAD/DEAH box helicase [Citricoccus sp. SGAir0253]